LLWHYHDDDVPGPEAEVDLVLSALPLRSGDATLRHFRIDETHSNAFAEWKRIGSPQNPSVDQYDLLEKAGQLATIGAPGNISVKDGETTLKLKLPRQAVSLIQISW
jgi:xylan 1,4-beta-xylosidase